MRSDMMVWGKVSLLSTLQALQVLFLALVLLFAGGGVQAAPAPHIADVVAAARLAGEGTFRWYGFSVYDAALWVGERGYSSAKPDAAPFVLDLLPSVDSGLAVVLLLTAIYVKQPVEFSVFPSLLLLLTLIRLSLNVASTRLVLMHGQDGVDLGVEQGFLHVLEEIPLRPGREAQPAPAQARRIPDVDCVTF